MSVAKLQVLNGEVIGIVRVYAGHDTEPPAPYKFFTVAVIKDGSAEIIGLSEARITTADANSLLAELARYSKETGINIQTVRWEHKGERHEKVLQH